MLEGGFTDGQGRHNAYPSAYTRGPDGRFHVAWVWRAQGGSTMNSRVSYARSSDLRNWEDAAGNPLSLPITYDTTPVAAPVQNDQGMVNGHQHVGFDAQQRPIVTYVRYDADRIAQAFLARFEAGEWRQYQITQLDRVVHAPNRRGNPTPRSIAIGTGPVLQNDGTIDVNLSVFGRPTTITVDGETLQPMGQCTRPGGDDPLAKWAEHEDDRLQFRSVASRGNPTDTENVSMISWHTSQGNRDRASEDIPQPSTLRVHVLKNAPGD